MAPMRRKVEYTAQLARQLPWHHIELLRGAKPDVVFPCRLTGRRMRRSKWARIDTRMSRRDMRSPSTSQDKDGLKRKDYESSLRELHVKLVELQEWVRHEGKKICILFEGRDGAGKGGAIKAITARVSPRVFRVVALPAPTEREKSQMYIQRYLPHLPSGGEIVIFDRSWYNRAGVERVMGFCTRGGGQALSQHCAASGKGHESTPGSSSSSTGSRSAPKNRKSGSETGSMTGARPGNFRHMDLKSFARWDDYTRARDDMFMATDTAWAPWFVVRSDDKRRARLNIIEHLLASIPYKPLPREKIKLPKRHVSEKPALQLGRKFIPEVH